MDKKPTVTYSFYNIPEREKSKLIELVNDNIEGKSDSYIESIYAHNPDAEMKIDYKIEQDKKNRYLASFRFYCDGELYPYKNKKSYKYAKDLVNSAFKHFNLSVIRNKDK